MLGAMGARWGLMAEEAFRSGMAGILRDQFGWQVEHVLMMDADGVVFGRPDQVEIDIAIHDGAPLADRDSLLYEQGRYVYFCAQGGVL